MAYSTLKLDISAGLANLTINRPEALNALSMQVLEELNQALDVMLKEKVRVAILQGGGEKSFVAGADIKEIHTLKNPQEGYEYARTGQNLFRKIERLPFPTMAKVQGFALGGGLELALSTDMILASTKAKFGLPECGLGLIPGFGGTVRLSRRIGPQRAKQVALMGNILTAQEAFELGFVNKVVEPEALDETAQKWAETMLQNAPLALKAIKESIDVHGHLPVDEAFEKEAALFRDLFNSKDIKEGLGAFLEKRQPQFEGQ